MNIYLEFWKRQLAAISKKINPSIANAFTIPDSGISQLGNRADYNGYADFWLRKNEKFSNKAVFRDLLKVLQNDVKPQQFLKNVIGNIEIRVTNTDDIVVNYTPITYKSILDKYSVIQQDANYLNEEIYKWELVALFQDAWAKYEAKQITFTDFFKLIKFNNLVFLTGVTTYNHCIKDAPAEFEQVLLYLFDESIDLQERIINYQIKFKALYFTLPNHGENTFEEERSIATWLAFRYPNKYTFYKDEFYTKLCKGLGIKTQKPLYKLVHYYQLVNDFILNHLINETKIINANKSRLPVNCFKDENYLILAQDVLYATLIVYAKANDYDLEEDDDIIVNQNLNNDENMQNTKHPINKILYGPPGTGKTYHTIDNAIMIIENLSKEEFYIKYTTRSEITSRFKELLITDFNKMNGQIVFTTFHQSMSYEDFIEGIKPNLETESSENLSYSIQPGIFKKLCDEARIKKQSSFDEAYYLLIADIQNTDAEEIELQTATGKPFWISINANTNLNLFTGKSKQKNGTIKKDGLAKEANGEKYFNAWESYSNGIFKYLKDKHNFVKQQKTIETKPYVIIIDEVNRGNVSQIFGELITLIEEDKRIGKNEALEITLPYSKESFGVPPNLYIIGTMNTADRSVEALDTALRRRFVFEEVNSRPELIATDGKSQETFGMVDGVHLVSLLQTINARIEKLLDKDHQIGHAFFMNVASKDDLDMVFENKIIPLLQEYFYGDYGKIGLVLGESFIELDMQNYDFAPFKYYDESIKRDYQEKRSFKFTNKEFWNYESIYSKNYNLANNG